MDELRALGLTPVINAAGPVTRMGGHRLSPEVTAAMAATAHAHFAIDDLQAWAGARIANATGAEAGHVTAGAAAGLLLGVAACIAGDDPATMDALPNVPDARSEVIVQRGHRNAYDHAIRSAGPRLVEVGYLGYPGAGRTLAWQLEAAIGPRTAAIFFAVINSPGTLGLAEVVEIARRHAVPVVVDAAAALPPIGNLRRFIDEGADLVSFSGGKALGGPQASGILCGRADLIRSAAAQHLDMDVDEWIWQRTRGTPGPPHHGIGRTAKVGKEAIVGLIVALDRFLSVDHDAEADRQHALLTRLVARLDSSAGIDARLVPRGVDGRFFPHIVIDFGGPEGAGLARAATWTLRQGDPPIFLGEASLDRGHLTLLATTITETEGDLVVERIIDAFGQVHASEVRP